MCRGMNFFIGDDESDDEREEGNVDQVIVE